ncbi:DUF1045 domain-containing protein [Zavarzinia sp.]|uniref:DUF1045 domain-containing protein n=1 Tax=Zavarzinia sp. TaxID=2027920 RepID=UPI003564D61E
MPTRYALYWAPAADTPLHRLGSHWLGRDAASGAAVVQPALDPITPARFAELTAEARVYGFHATLKPPMCLKAGRDLGGFRAAVTAAAAAFAAFTAPPLKVGRIGRFLALVPAGDMAGWRALSNHFVAALDDFRAPAGEAELARRRKSGLSPAQDENLLRWGYPYVFDEWRFHMTLSAPLASPERERVEVAALAHFAGIERKEVAVSDVCLFVQEGAGTPFRIAERFPLGASCG